MEKNKLYQQPKEVLSFLNTKLFLIFIAFLPITIFLFIITIPFFIIMWIHLNLDFKNTSFSVSDQELTYNYGIIVKHSKNIMLDQIQNINIGQGILEKQFKIKSISIWTSSHNQIHSDGKNIQINPSAFLRLKDSDADSFKLLLRKI